MLRRRLRGLIAMTAGGALVGAIMATLLSLIALLIPGQTIVTPQFPGAVVVVPAVLGGVFGAMSGAAFGVLLMLAERGRGIADLQVWRMALWAAVASAAVVGITASSWHVAAVASVIGAAAGGAAFLAKRSAERAMVDGDSSVTREAQSTPASA